MNEVSEPGQKKLTIVGITATVAIAVVGAVWFLLSHFYISRDIVDKDWIQRKKYEDLRDKNDLTVRELENTRIELIVQKERAIATEADNKTKDILNVLIERRDELANTIINVESEYITISESGYCGGRKAAQRKHSETICYCDKGIN